MENPESTRFWEDRHIDPAWTADLRLDEGPAWKVGDSAVRVRTRSGAVYEISADGQMSGGSKHVVGARLVGAFSPGSPMLRSKCIVLDLCIEFWWAGGYSDPRRQRYTTSTVLSVEPIL